MREGAKGGGSGGQAGPVHPASLVLRGIRDRLSFVFCPFFLSIFSFFFYIATLFRDIFSVMIFPTFIPLFSPSPKYVEKKKTDLR